MITFENLFGTMKFVSEFEKNQMKLMFEFYISELPNNFYKNQFDLANDFPGTTYEQWVKMLKHPAFDTWKSEQIAIIASTETDKALAGGGLGDKEAVNLLKARRDILADENKIDKPTIIVLPESLFFKEE